MMVYAENNSTSPWKVRVYHDGEVFTIREFEVGDMLVLKDTGGHSMSIELKEKEIIVRFPDDWWRRNSISKWIDSLKGTILGSGT